MIDCHHLDVWTHIIPGHHGVPASQSGGVQLKDGGDIHAVRNWHQSVHDFLLWRSQTTSQGLIIRIKLEQKNKQWEENNTTLF